METTDTPAELSVEEEPITAHLSLDTEWSWLSVIEFGSVWDGQPAEQVRTLAEDERLQFLLRDKDGVAIGFMVHEPHRFDPYALEDPLLWELPRFNVPLLGMPSASVGEIVLAVRGRYPPGEPTIDVAFFYMAVNAAHDEDDLESAEGYWRVALEAGDMRGHFGLGYTLYDLGRYREAYDHLRVYTELTPFNAWAWCWFGKACEGMGESREAARAYWKAIELEKAGSFETDAPALLGSLLADR